MIGGGPGGFGGGFGGPSAGDYHAFKTTTRAAKSSGGSSKGPQGPGGGGNEPLDGCGCLIVSVIAFLVLLPLYLLITG